MTLQTNLLIGEKVKLAPYTKDDQQSVTKWWNDIDFVRLMDTGMFRPTTIEKQEEEHKGLLKNNHAVPFSIRTTDDNTLIGYIGAMNINWQARHCMVVIGIGEKDYWDKGYGTDAMRVLLRYAFMEMNMNRVGLEVVGYNQRAIKSYEKIGFVHEVTMRQFVWRDGQYFDAHIMSILREEWDTQQS